MKNKKYSVLVTGYPSMDHIIKINTPAKVGFTSLVSNKDNTDIYYGGCSVNIAYALSKLGVSALPAIRVGNDFEKIGFKKFLEDNNVSLDSVKKIGDDITSTTYLLEDNNGDHITIFYPGAMDEKYFNEVDDSLFINSELGVITVGPAKDNLYFAQKCLEYNLPIVFGMKGDIVSLTKPFLLKVLNNSKIIFTNESEKQTIEELFDLNSITDFFETGICEVIVTTKGKEGSTYYQNKNNKIESGSIKAYDLFERKDTTGCGDGYISGFLYGYLNGFSVAECCLYGSLVSSFVLSGQGCCTALPTKAQLELEFDKRKEEI